MQFERVSAGSTTASYAVLGLTYQKDAGGSTYFTRDNTGGLIGERTPGGKYYYLFDGLGSVVATTDGTTGAVVSTYTYEPYGSLISSTGSAPNPWLFTGQYLDSATGLYKIGARFYDSTLGRWTQQDPAYHLGDAQQVNRYGYAGDNPVNLSDPSGLYVDPSLIPGYGSQLASDIYAAGQGATFALAISDTGLAVVPEAAPVVALLGAVIGVYSNETYGTPPGSV